ncbi:MAG: methionine--tRNA ligase, partial [Clostridia bacterium]|nr:methionine--tRNA ligase [Clostridia bacterium]
CGRPVQRTKEEAYFFAMSKYAPALIRHIEDHPEFIEPESRKKEMVNNFLKAGLQDLCVSRSSFKWGVPVTFDDRHVIYVWIDALSNYVTALGYDPDLDKQPELYEKCWPADVHIIGKDILRFHTIYWPIILMALGEPLPKKIFGHPWFNSGADKMSKSRGNVIYADELAETFSVDGVRYYALSEMPFNADGSITYESVVNRYNTDLANNLGNLVSRTHAMTVKYFGGVVPAPVCPEPLDEELKQAVKNAKEKSRTLMDAFHVADALSEIFESLRRANKYIDETTPWILAKDETKKERLGTVLYNLLETIRYAAVLLTPFLPFAAEKIFSQLGTDRTSYNTVSSFGALEAGKPLGDASVLFARIDEKKFTEELAAKEKAKEEKAKAEEAAVIEHEKTISVQEFGKVELRTAQILSCEKVPKAKKLYKLQIDLGYEKRQIVSGIASYYTPEELIGKKVVVVTNLMSAVLCGVESNGMLLAAGGDTVRVVFLDQEQPLGERTH